MIKNNHFSNQKYLYILLILFAVVIRLILMPISAHSDLFVINMFPSLLWRQNVVDILSYSKEHVNRVGFSYYPPLTYFTFGIFQFFYQPFSNTFFPWIDQLRTLYIGSFDGQAPDYIKQVSNPMIFRDIFLVKTPYLIFDMGCILILSKFIKRKIVNKKTIILWLFNPVLLYGAYTFGQFDIIPTFFILLGFLLISKNPSLGILSIGIAGAFKNYAFIFIIPLVIIYGNSLASKARLAIIAFIPTTIFIIPTLLNNPHEAVFAVFNRILLQSKRPLEGWALYSQILRYLALASSYFFVILLAFLNISKNKWRFSIGLCYISILLLLTIAPRTSFHYLFWAFPLTILWFRRIKTAALILIVQTISFASYKVLAPQLQAGLFAPINPDYFYSLPTVNNLVNQVVPYQIISSTGFFIFLFFNFFLIFMIIYELLFKAEIDFAKQDQK